jgi:AbrB family looped-hinge helix DNA binding protein
MNVNRTRRRTLTSSVTSKGQVTIPVEIRRLLQLSTSDKVAFRVEDGRVEISPLKSVAARTAGALRKYRRNPAPTAREERDSFEQAVADEVSAGLNR